MSTGVASLFDRDCVTQTHSTFYDWSCGRVLSHPPHLTSTSHVNAARPACDIPPLASASFQVCCVAIATIIKFHAGRPWPLLTPRYTPHASQPYCFAFKTSISLEKRWFPFSHIIRLLFSLRLNFIFIFSCTRRCAIPHHNYNNTVHVKPLVCCVRNQIIKISFPLIPSTRRDHARFCTLSSKIYEALEPRIPRLLPKALAAA